jgi:hypothetical protein
MDTDELKYCADCGCEIIQKEDIGFEYTEKEYRRDYPMLKNSAVDVIEKPFTICITCSSETEKEWEEFKKSPIGQYECYFQKWVTSKIGERPKPEKPKTDGQKLVEFCDRMMGKV